MLVKDEPPMVPGQTFPPDGDYGSTLNIGQSSGNYLAIQFPPRIALSPAQMADFAAGVHVHKDAATGVG